MAYITVVPLFKNKALSAGDTGTSGIIDLREICRMNKFSLHYVTAGGTSTTAGTTNFSYVGCSTIDGTFVSPVTDGTFGTSGTGKSESKIIPFGTSGEPLLCAFMKIIATQNGAGKAGAQSIVAAELHVQ